jgi:hypothetical protein
VALHETEGVTVEYQLNRGGVQGFGTFGLQYSARVRVRTAMFQWLSLVALIDSEGQGS